MSTMLITLECDAAARHRAADIAGPRAKNARRRFRVHRIPAPTFVTMANAPLMKAG
jgi:hypothetical protein